MIGKYTQRAVEVARRAVQFDETGKEDQRDMELAQFRDIPGISVYGPGRCPKLRYRTPAGGTTAHLWHAVIRWAAHDDLPTAGKTESLESALQAIAEMKVDDDTDFREALALAITIATVELEKWEVAP